MSWRIPLFYQILMDMLIWKRSFAIGAQRKSKYVFFTANRKMDILHPHVIEMDTFIKNPEQQLQYLQEQKVPIVITKAAVAECFTIRALGEDVKNKWGDYDPVHSFFGNVHYELPETLHRSLKVSISTLQQLISL